jgi:glyoxylase-like metal-dependent hydrolase (beta-lactamase superfamily II)/rhodanese-related sulfurtransferase
MYIKQLYTNCLAEAAYYIESEGEAAIIDPLREYQPYMDLAAQRNARIRFVFETHFHADFVSGHIDLAAHTGSTIVFGPNAHTSYTVYNAKDQEVFRLGKISIKALHTPGHTPESTCYLLIDEYGKEHCIFTGDTLFVGDVGRPDLLDGVTTKEVLAGMLYDSLNAKIKTLPDDVIVYPAHGPGSSCGKNIGKETWSTIGEQKKTNYALADMGREQFITAVTEGLTAPPAYFFHDAMVNKNGYESFDTVLHRNMRPMTPGDFAAEMKNGCRVVDTRDSDIFGSGFIGGAMNIGLEGTFAVWLGTVVPADVPLLVVSEEGKEEETIMRMSRVGYDQVIGYLQGGMKAWKEAGYPIDTLPSITADEFARRLHAEPLNILDVRREGEVVAGHVRGATHICLTRLEQNMDLLDRGKEYHVYCGGGYRSMIACSMLKRSGFERPVNVSGGWASIRNTDIEVDTGSLEHA